MVRKLFRDRRRKTPPRDIVIKGQKIREDADGRLCLDDIWALAGASQTKRPKFLRQNPSLKAVVRALLEKVRSYYQKPDLAETSVIYAVRGRTGGTYAHPVLAAVYAGYLLPELEVEVREVWLRYRQGDASLADEILQQATQEANEWAGIRALSRAKRTEYTDTLKQHGVRGPGYAICTDAVYRKILGAPAAHIRAARNLPGRKANIRDHLETAELGYVTAAEMLATERIKEEDRYGNDDCRDASARSAGFIANAIAADRADRRKPNT